MDTHSPPVSTTVSQKTETELAKESTENGMSKKPNGGTERKNIRDYSEDQREDAGTATLSTIEPLLDAMLETLKGLTRGDNLYSSLNEFLELPYLNVPVGQY